MEERSSEADRGFDAVVLVLSAGVLAASFALGVKGGACESVTVAGIPLPSTCFLRPVAGLDCPTCGLTRSFVNLAHGRLGAACADHRLGPALFLVFVFQVPYRTFRLARKSAPPRFPSRAAWVIGLAFVAAFWLNWVYNVATGAAWHG